jgi:hypothetical protein
MVRLDPFVQDAPEQCGIAGDREFESDRRHPLDLAGNPDRYTSRSSIFRISI